MFPSREEGLVISIIFSRLKMKWLMELGKKNCRTLKIEIGWFYGLGGALFYQHQSHDNHHQEAQLLCTHHAISALLSPPTLPYLSFCEVIAGREDVGLLDFSFFTVVTPAMLTGCVKSMLRHNCFCDFLFRHVENWIDLSFHSGWYSNHSVMGNIYIHSLFISHRTMQDHRDIWDFHKSI